MISPSLLSPSRIHGLFIAAGRATWVLDDNDKGYYSFVDQDSFSWKVHTAQLKQLNVDEQDVLDCLVQAEKQFGSPEDVQQKLGIQPGQGWLSIGAKFVSKNNPQVMCVFTPTSMEYPIDGASQTDAYFEFYYAPQEVPMEKPEIASDEWFKEMEKLMPKKVEKKTELAVPTYEEACAFTEGCMMESIREDFLQKVWNYHKFVAPGYKQALAEDILSTWKRVTRVQSVLPLYGE